MNHVPANPDYLPRPPTPVGNDLRRPAPWISLTLAISRAIVTTVSPRRGRDFTKSVTV